MKGTSNNHKGKKKTKKKHGSQLSFRGIATIAVMLLILLLVLVLVVNSFTNRNDITKVSAKLDSNIGKSISDVEKSTRVEFNKSVSNTMLGDMVKFDYVSTPSSNIRVCGVKLPKWIIYVRTNKLEEITQFTVYDFTTLEDSILGCKLSERLDSTSYVGTTESSLLETTGINPYVTYIFEDGTKQLYFRYYYRDTSLKNDVSVQLCVDLDANGQVVNVTESDIDFITDILALENLDN
jgi:hypothetical protein